MPKFTVPELKQMIPDDSVEAAFLRRPDIACLDPEEQQRRWQEHMVHVEEFWERISKLDVLVCDVREP